MFKADRSLINPGFEGYKLDPIEQENHVSSFPLPCGAFQATVSASARSRIHITFEEMRSRIRHNHLAMGKTGEALYIDEEMGVNLIRIQGEQPVIKRICELPKSIQTLSATTASVEPSAICIDEMTWLICDGSGYVHLVVHVNDEQSYQICGTFEVIPSDEEATACPFTLCSASRRQGTVLVLISSKPPVDSNPSTKGKNVLYRIHAISIPTIRPNGDVIKLHPLWTIHGRDLPLFVDYSEQHNAFLVLASASYGPLAVDSQEYPPRVEEVVPIPQANENLNVLKPPPYSWTQTSESLTIAFPLPAGITAKEIHVHLARRALTMLIKPNEHVDPSLIIPRYAAKEFWGEIRVAESLWTWDNDDNHTYGLLTLHLEKNYGGTRWPHVFSSEEIEVQETVDPSELANIRDLLEKYTSGQEDLGLGRGVPSLAEGEADEEVDSNVGRSIVPTWVTESGFILGTARDRTPFNVLSTPFTGSPTPSDAIPISVIVKQAVDGLVLFSSPLVEKGGVPGWSHLGTFSALSFVLASKRDVKFTFHTDSAVFAFESGASGNVYIYKKTQSTQDRWAKQAILKVSGGTAGALLGAGLVTWENKKYVIVLCEKEVKIVRDTI